MALHSLSSARINGAFHTPRITLSCYRHYIFPGFFNPMYLNMSRCNHKYVGSQDLYKVVSLKLLMDGTSLLLWHAITIYSAIHYTEGYVDIYCSAWLWDAQSVEDVLHTILKMPANPLIYSSRKVKRPS